ncbi:hypothetical protein ACROYT_G001917 [Oculina patagonica]
MIFLLALSICHIVIPLAAAQDFNPLGRGVYLPDFNLVGHLPKSGHQILNALVLKKCTMEAPEEVTEKGFNYYRDRGAFYSSVATAYGVQSSLKTDFSLGVTLGAASREKSALGRSVTGNSLLIEASYGQEMLNKNCLMFEKNFDPEFLNRFRALPDKISDPWLPNAWTSYDAFLKYGSHVVTSTLLGSSINQMVFAETVDSYSERDFKVKSCLFLAGTKDTEDIPDLGVSICSGIDKSEISQVSKMSMSDYLTIRGGTAATRNELFKHRTADLIVKFMNEAKATKSAIQYTLTPIWEILQTLYVGKDTPNFVRAVNLEYYYLGFLNYGCYPKSDGEQDLQKFDFAKGSSAKSPQYECSLAPEGCHSDDDCNLRAVAWCSCRGPSCVQYRFEKLDYTCKEKKTAEINMDADWDWHGCERKYLSCYCSSPSRRREKVWGIENKNALYQAHFVSLNRNISKEKDEL